MFGFCCERQRKNSDTSQSDEEKYLDRTNPHFDRTQSERSRHDHDLIMILNYETFIEDLEVMLDRDFKSSSRILSEGKAKDFRKKIKALKKKHLILRREVFEIHVTY